MCVTGAEGENVGNSKSSCHVQARLCFHFFFVWSRACVFSDTCSSFIVVHSKLVKGNNLLKPILWIEWVTARDAVLAFVCAKVFYRVQGLGDGSEKEGKPYSLPKITTMYFPLSLPPPPLVFLPLCRSPSWAVKKRKERERFCYHGGGWSREKCIPVGYRIMLLFWGLCGDIGQFITSLLSSAVSDIPWNSSLSFQALTLFSSRFI